MRDGKEDLVSSAELQVSFNYEMRVLMFGKAELSSKRRPCDLQNVHFHCKHSSVDLTEYLMRLSAEAEEDAESFIIIRGATRSHLSNTESLNSWAL